MLPPTAPLRPANNSNSSNSSDPASTPLARIAALSSHLSSPPAPSPTNSSTIPPPPQTPTTTMATPTKPPITCHVLDTTIGRPAAGISVKLTLANPAASLLPRTQDEGNTSSSATVEPLSFHGTTNEDGRVAEWSASSPLATSISLTTAFHAPQAEKQRYTLSFSTLAYFESRGVMSEQECFFDEVVVGFAISQARRERREHFHVPVLLSGFGYTVYRGS